VPEGTSIQVVTIDSIDSKKDTVGGTFMASLYAPLTVGEQVVAPKGSNVSIKLLGAATSGNFKGKSELHLALDSIEAQGKRYPVQSSTYSEVGKSQGKQTAKKVGVGAAVGATIGAIAGGGKGAAIGAGVGAGAGTAAQVLTKGDQVNVPSETRLEFKLEMPLEITIQPK
jgi:YmgG-like glycine-zipper protein